MALPYGVSFLPSGDLDYRRRSGDTATGGSPVQQAIKILSLRVPRVVGGTPLAPLALLTGPGSGGLPESFIQQLQRMLPAQTSPQAPPTATVPVSPAPVALLPAPPALLAPAPVPQPVPAVPPIPMPMASSGAPMGPLRTSPPVMPTVTGAAAAAPLMPSTPAPAWSAAPLALRAPLVRAGAQTEAPALPVAAPPMLPDAPAPDVSPDLVALLRSLLGPGRMRQA